MEITLYTELNLNQCLRELESVPQAPLVFFPHLKSSLFVRNLTGFRFEVHYYAVLLKNAQIFRGQLSPYAEGTRIKGDFELAPEVKAFYLIFFAVFAFASSIPVLRSLTAFLDGKELPANWLNDVSFIMGWLFLGGAIFALMYGIDKFLERYTLNALQDLLHAKRIDSGSAIRNQKSEI